MLDTFFCIIIMNSWFKVLAKVYNLFLDTVDEAMRNRESKLCHSTKCVRNGAVLCKIIARVLAKSPTIASKYE